MFTYLLTCVDCWCEWSYEKEQAGGRRPKRCPECTKEHKLALGRAATKRWNAANPEKRREIRNRWVENNPEAMATMRRAWWESHQEKVRSYRRITKKRNPEANRSYVQARRARKKSQTVVPFTAEQLRQRLAFFGGRCWMCGDPAEVLDHVKPLSKGGAHALSNMRPACSTCNTRKGAQWLFPTSPSWFRGAMDARIASALSRGPSVGTKPSTRTGPSSSASHRTARSADRPPSSTPPARSTQTSTSSPTGTSG